MEATTLVVADPAVTVPIVTKPTSDDSRDTTAIADQLERTTSDLRRLMDLADRYARQLVASADTPPGVLLLVHGDNLDVVTLDGPDPDLRGLPRLLARSRPSSAVLVVAPDGALGRADGDLVLVLGETSDGQRDEHRFRVRACGRTRRLTRLPDHDASEAPRAVPRLFSPQATRPV